MHRSAGDSLAGREIIFEFRSAGAATQVCAVDCASGIEVFVTTPLNMMRMDQQSLALRKLAKALIDQGITATNVGTIEHGARSSEAPRPAKRGFLA